MNVSIDRRMFVAGLAALAAMPGGARAQAYPEGPEAVAAHVEQLVREFLARVPGDHGYEAPEVRIEFTPRLAWISWDKPHVIRVAAWEQCPPEIRAFFASLLSVDASEAEAATFYRDSFYNFIVPHEMAHFVDYQHGRSMETDAFYQSEVQANRVAIAFWIERPGGEAWLSSLVPRIEAIVAALPDPVPPGEEAMAYFNANYQSLGADPQAYGWFQYRMVLDAWARREEADFASLVA